MSDTMKNLVIYGLIGIVLLLLCAVSIKDVNKLRIAFGVNMAAVFIGVALTELGWRVLGRGNPPDRTCTLADGLRNAGVVWFWLSRIGTTDTRREKYRQLLSGAKEVDLMGFNLATEIFDVEEIRKPLAEAVRNGARVRVFILAPRIGKRGAARRRLAEPGELKGKKAVLPRLLRESENGMADIYAKLADSEAQRGNFLDGIRYATIKAVIRCMIVRIDDQLFVCNYLTSFMGNETPGMQIQRQNGGLFEKYCKEFEEAYNGKGGRKLMDQERARIMRTAKE